METGINTYTTVNTDTPDRTVDVIETEKESEQLINDVLIFDKKAEARRNRAKIYTTISLIVLLIFYLYLRLFNTGYSFTPDYNPGENMLQIEYSTAWFVRVPSEYKGQRVDIVSGGRGVYSEGYTPHVPHILYLYLEDGIKAVEDFGNMWGETCESSTVMGYPIAAVRLPNTLEMIGGCAFLNCQNLRSVSIPEKAENGLTVRMKAFACTSIQEFVFPEGTNCLWGEQQFAYCKNLKRVEFPSTVEEFNNAKSLFYGCKNLEYVRFPENIKHLEGRVFYGCENLKEVIFPTALETIDSGAFEESAFWEKELSQINLPESVYFARTKGDLIIDADKLDQYIDKDSETFVALLNARPSYKIEDKVYHLPYSLDEFAAIDSWDIGIPSKQIGDVRDYHTNFYPVRAKHKTTGRQITLILNEKLYVVDCDLIP